ncbi:MAG TPA: hypothetical protein VF228_17440 [Iamia sp.]
MDDGVDVAEVGQPVEEAAVLGGLRKRKDTGRRAHRHEGGLVVEDRDGTVVLPYATTQVFTGDAWDEVGSDPLKGKAEWTFVRRGARWTTGSIDRSSPLAVLCRAATDASTAVRLAIVRQRLAGGDTVDFDRISATAHELWVHGHRPLPWAEIERLAFPALEPVALETVSRGRFTVADKAAQIADLAVLIALIDNGR